jgi:DNA-binding XRE family transcriptional regulator
LSLDVHCQHFSWHCKDYQDGKGGEKKCYKLIMYKEALREWRKSQGLTRKKLAGMLGVTPMALWAVHVSRYRNSKLLAKIEAYRLSLKNCIYDPHIIQRPSWGERFKAPMIERRQNFNWKKRRQRVEKRRACPNFS